MNEKTASEVNEEQNRLSLLRHKLHQALLGEARRRLVGPKLVVVGFDDYLELKRAILVSCGELIPRHSDKTADAPLMVELTRAGVECFFWNGVLVMQTTSFAHCGPFFL